MNQPRSSRAKIQACLDATTVPAYVKVCLQDALLAHDLHEELVACWEVLDITEEIIDSLLEVTA